MDRERIEAERKEKRERRESSEIEVKREKQTRGEE